MAGTKEGGRKTAKKLGPEFYSQIGKRGKKGGKYSAGSFGNNPQHTQQAARKGGQKSRRGKGKVAPSLKNYNLYYEDLPVEETD